MSQQVINVGTVAGDNTGDPGRTAFIKINANFSELYGATGINPAIALTYAQTAAELAAGVTPTNLGYLPGDYRRYGIAGNASQMVTYAPFATTYGVGAPSDSDGSNTLTGSYRLYVGNGTPTTDDSAILAYRNLSGSYSTGAHGFRDETTYSSPSGSGFYGYSSFDAIPTIGGSVTWNHAHCYQARIIYTGSGTNQEIYGYGFQLTHNGAGTVTNSYGLRMYDALGTGPIGNQAAVWVDNLTRGSANYVIYSGSTSVASYHGGKFQMGTAPQITAAGWTTYGSLITHDATGNFVDNPNCTIISGVLSLKEATAKVQATATSLQLNSTAGNVTLNSTSGAVVMNTNVQVNANGQLNVGAATTGGAFPLLVNVTTSNTAASFTDGTNSLNVFISGSVNTVGSGSATPLGLASNGNTGIKIATNGNVTVAPNVAVPAGGSVACGISASSTASLGVYFGSGAPTFSAAQGSLYMRTDGSSTSTRAYVNTNGSTSWTNIVTAT